MLLHSRCRAPWNRTSDTRSGKRVARDKLLSNGTTSSASPWSRSTGARIRPASIERSSERQSMPYRIAASSFPTVPVSEHEAWHPLLGIQIEDPKRLGALCTLSMYEDGPRVARARNEPGWGRPQLSLETYLLKREVASLPGIAPGGFRGEIDVRSG